MFRLFFLAFHGKSRTPILHVHEDPWMTMPIVVLAVPAAIAGWFTKDQFAAFFTPPVVAEYSALSPPDWIPIAATAAGAIGITLAWFFYGRDVSDPQAALQTKNRSSAWHLLYNKFYFDEMYYKIVRGFLFAKVAGGLKWIDSHLIDPVGDKLAGLLQWGGKQVRALQSGYTPYYILFTLLGVLLWRFLGSLPL
jgi:NADH-quinone oxidoreductase subunit L